MGATQKCVTGATQNCVPPESFIVSDNSAHVLCIDRKPRSELNDTNISFGVPGCIFWAVESIDFTTIVFTLPHIMVPKFARQLLIRKVACLCNYSRNVWNWESWSRCTRTLENATPYKIYCDNFFNICYSNLQRGFVIRAIYVETAKTNADELWKPMHQSFWFADLRIWVSSFRNCYANAADHMTKSDLKNKIQNNSGDYEVTFARNSLYMWKCRHL